MNIDNPNPPYFDVLFDRISSGDSDAVTAFGRHVHWGCWDDPTSADGSADDYDRAAENLCCRLCDVAEIRTGIRLADVGCGFGGTIGSLNDRFDSLDMVGINIDSRQLQRASEQVVARGDNRIQWIEADAANLPLEDASVDAMLAVECIFHFDRFSFLAEASRVLKPGGSLTISDFVPTESMAAFLARSDFADGAAVKWSYGQVDMTCSMQRYEEMAAGCSLHISEAIDITECTLPTYDFLLGNSDDWPEREQAELFREATSWLKKASAKGMVQYMIIRFEK